MYYLLFNKQYDNPNNAQFDVQACYEAFTELGVRGIIDLNDYAIGSIVSNNHFYQNFSDSMKSIESLLNLKVDEGLEMGLFKMLYTNVVTHMETYLSDAFINTVLSNETYKAKFLESTPEFIKMKISYSEILKELKSMDQTIKDQMLAVIYHNIGKVHRMYLDTLGVTFPKDLKEIYDAVTIRHDLVHRGGKNKSGIETKLTRKDIERLISHVRTFINGIDEQLEGLKK